MTSPATRRSVLPLLLAAPLAAGVGVAGAAGQEPTGTVPGGCASRWSPASLPEAGVATRPPAERAGLDVLAYDLALDLTGAAAGRLDGHATLRVRTDAALDAIRLDLVGLAVDSARLDGRPASCRHDGAVLELRRAGGGSDGGRLAPGRHRVDVFYGGVPRDGLAFGTGGRGEPTAFADNWPNRARWWFPSNDHPSDKARVRFEVLAPAGHPVVANGAKVAGPVPVSGDETAARWVWATRVPLPTYLMVVGMARFRRLELGEAACGRAPEASGACVPVSVWALAGDSAFAAERFRRAPDMVDVYTRLFGPFPYAKLAHVESSTRFGGMENAGAIFYARQPWARGTMGEGVIAHETVHQWLGDAVTPARWRHLWLSEGFATYFAAVYFGRRDGPEAFRSRMDQARREALASDVAGRPVVDATDDLYSLLNANSYQKGAWVLHMLRGAVGDTAFFRGVRRYLRRHRHATACTSDLRRAMEAASGRDLRWFFRQWVREPGHPRLEAEWSTEHSPDGDGETLVLEVRQTQPTGWPTFRLPLEVVARTTGRGPGEGVTTRREATLTERTETLRIAVPGPVAEVTLDPEGRLLAAVEVRRRAREPAAAGPGPGQAQAARALSRTWLFRRATMAPMPLRRMGLTTSASPISW